MANLVENGLVTSEKESFTEEIRDTFLINKWKTEENRFRLKTIRNDQDAFKAVIQNEVSSFDSMSNITVNYNYFCERIQKLNRITVDDLVSALERLVIIDIFLHKEDDPQLIFESLNSTGLDLSESDKVRNYVLMCLDPKTQDEFYSKYWQQIEKYVTDNPRIKRGNENKEFDNFIRYFLTVEETRIVKDKILYEEFKRYTCRKKEESGLSEKEATEVYLERMLRYAKVYHSIINAKQGNPDDVYTIVARIVLLDITAIFPYLMVVLDKMNNNLLSETEVVTVLRALESYIFRRQFCNYPSNHINSMAPSIDKEVEAERKETTSYTPSYSEVFVSKLVSKVGRSVFPNDDEFKGSIRTRDCFQPTFKKYFFDRLENGDNKEGRKNIVLELESHNLTIEHIMPQTLTDEWKAQLGDGYEKLYEDKLHTISNITLTGYNSSYSNSLFLDKKNREKGFDESPLYLNQLLKSFNRWTKVEMEQREEVIIERMLKLWPFPTSSYILGRQKNSNVTLEEDTGYFTGRKLISFSFQNMVGVKMSKWVDMYTAIVKELYIIDVQVIRNLAAVNHYPFLKEARQGYTQIDTGVFLKTACSTRDKMTSIKQLFDEYGFDQSELTFVLSPEEATDDNPTFFDNSFDN